MQTLDSISRAKAFMRSQARTAALVIIPLAAVVSAYAGPVLPSGNFVCSYSPNVGSGGTCSGGVNAAGGAVSYYLASGGVLLEGGGTLMEHTNASVATAITAGSSIPFSYDIGLFAESAVDPNYSLNIQIKDTTTSTMLVNSTFPGTFGPGANTLSNSGLFTSLGSSNSGDNIVVGYLLTLSSVPENVGVNVTVPQGTSVDLGPVGAGTPEPASVGLMGGGLAWLGYLWRKRRKA
jgi:hypothetical protein